MAAVSLRRIARAGVITGGPQCIEVPDWQIHQYNEDFYILRQSGCTHGSETLPLYLLFGEEKALLEDTGAGKSDAAHVVSQVIAKWCALKNRPSIPLIVAHSIFTATMWPATQASKTCPM